MCYDVQNFFPKTSVCTSVYSISLLKTAYRKESFSSKHQTLKILQSIYFAYKVAIISSYSYGS